jgi:DNA-directed RNA polymerase subunit RPC12/RpoP
MSEYIEREAALAQTHEINITEVGYRHRCIDPQAIKEIPAADVTPVRYGHWKEESDYDGDSIYVCSECGETWTLIDGTPQDNNMHYCPNCGARMDVDGETTVETPLFDIIEEHDHCHVQVLRNSITGEISVGWWEEKE